MAWGPLGLRPRPRSRFAATQIRPRALAAARPLSPREKAPVTPLQPLPSQRGIAHHRTCTRHEHTGRKRQGMDARRAAARDAHGTWTQQTRLPPPGRAGGAPARAPHQANAIVIATSARGLLTIVRTALVSVLHAVRVSNPSRCFMPHRSGGARRSALSAAGRERSERRKFSASRAQSRPRARSCKL